MIEAGSWRKFDFSKEGELFRWLISLGSSVCFVSHIHIYGTAAALLGELGPVIAWPALMCSTMLFGQIWGFLLQEFVSILLLAKLGLAWLGPCGETSIY